VLAFGDLAGYRRHTFVTPRLPEKCVPRQIIHRDVKGLNFLLKEMSGYFETCICDFGAQSTSNSPRRWRVLGRACPAGVARVENLVDTVSKTGFKGTLAFMSPEQLEVDTCWVPQQPLRGPWRTRRMRRMSA
jgi:serine/threonine protein kinase